MTDREQRIANQALADVMATRLRSFPQKRPLRIEPPVVHNHVPAPEVRNEVHVPPQQVTLNIDSAALAAEVGKALAKVDLQVGSLIANVEEAASRREQLLLNALVEMRNRAEERDAQITALLQRLADKPVIEFNPTILPAEVRGLEVRPVFNVPKASVQVNFPRLKGSETTKEVVRRDNGDLDGTIDKTTYEYES